MNIDELTVGQIKEITKYFSYQDKSEKTHPFIGKYVLCRCYSSGVHTGILSEIDGDKVILKESRRLWSWKGNGVALSSVANGELKEGKVDSENPEIYLTGVIEIIPCSKKAEESIRCR